MVTRIKTLTKNSEDKTLDDRIQIFLDFFIFGLETTKSEKSIIKAFPLINTAAVHLFLLRLKLYLKYEGRVLLMPIFHFKVLLMILRACVQRFSNLDLVSPENMPYFSLILSIGAKIFIKDEAKLASVVPVVFDFNGIETSLLFGLRDDTIFAAPTFWQGYFDLKQKKNYPNAQSTKLKILKIAEVMMFYHYFFSGDLDATAGFIENCLSHYNANLRLLKKGVRFKVGETLHNVLDVYNARHRGSTRRALLSYREKIAKVLGLVATFGFLAAHELPKKIYLDRYIATALLKLLLKRRMYATRLSNKTRRVLWLQFVRLADLYEPPRQLQPHQDLSTASLEQIQMDVTRTRQWRGKPYVDKMQSLLLSFFYSQPGKLEYFQGFNFIVAFLHEIFPDQVELSVVLSHVARHLIPVG